MPVGDQPGWRQVYADDFTGSSLGPGWGAYSGRPGSDPYTMWSPSQVAVQDGVLTLRGQKRNGQWVTGGVSNHTVTQTYGKWEVRFRIDPSDDLTYALLLWPNMPVWPPEIDFAEDGGGARRSTVATLHHGRNAKVAREVDADFSQWHTVGVEWVPGQLTYTLDGRPWTTVASSAVPDIPMWLAIQAQGGGCEKHPGRCPVAGSPAAPALQVDWVVVYARA
jgi:beta-glucanase (GH16 family)